MKNNKFKKNDKVIIIAGSDKGKVSSIIKFKDNKVLLKGISIATLHQKPTSNKAGEIVKKEKYIDLSNISHFADGKPIKVKFEISSIDKNVFNKSLINKKTGKKLYQ